MKYLKTFVLNLMGWGVPCGVILGLFFWFVEAPYFFWIGLFGGLCFGLSEVFVNWTCDQAKKKTTEPAGEEAVK